MEQLSRRRTRLPRRNGFRWRSTRPKILKDRGDAPLSARGRFEYRLVLLVIVGIGVYAMLVVELTRH